MRKSSVDYVNLIKHSITFLQFCLVRHRPGCLDSILDSATYQLGGWVQSPTFSGHLFFNGSCMSSKMFSCLFIATWKSIMIKVQFSVVYTWHRLEWSSIICPPSVSWSCFSARLSRWVLSLFFDSYSNGLPDSSNWTPTGTSTYHVPNPTCLSSPLYQLFSYLSILC